MKPFAEEKRRNRVLWEEDIAEKREVFRANPPLLTIEPTNRCNAACPICARRYWREPNNPPVDLQPEILERLTDFLVTAETVFAFGHGEPTIAPHFRAVVETARRYGCRVEITTNGLELDEPFLEWLIDVGVDILNVSLDAVEPRTLQQRRGLEIKRIEAVFAALNRRKHAAGARAPEAGIAVVIDRDNLDELPGLLRFAADLNVKTLLVNHLVAWHESLHMRSAYHEPDRLRSALADLTEQATLSGVAVVLPFAGMEQGRCPHPLNLFFVRADGEVWPCCNAVFRNARYSFPAGNLVHTPPRDIWNGGLYRALRRAFLAGDPLLPHCRICPLLNDNLASHLRSLDDDRSH